MPPRSGSTAFETLRPGGRVHVLGAGPVGLLITALLQSMDGMFVHLYEKRPAYTRTRMVTLAPYLVADSVASYRVDDIDGESVDAIFDPAELVAGLAGRRAIPSDLMALLRAWALGFCPLNTIERTLSDLIDGRGSDAVVRDEAVVTVEEAIGMLEPDDVLIDCTGSRSLLRDQLMRQTEQCRDRAEREPCRHQKREVGPFPRRDPERPSRRPDPDRLGEELHRQ